MVTQQSDSHAPHSLELLIEFVNTLDIEQQTDAIATPAALAGWLRERGLLAAEVAKPARHDLDRAIELREALRAMMLANNGEADDESAGAALERAARRGELGVHFDAAGRPTLEPGARGMAAALARLLVPVVDSAADGSWGRVKACRAPDCRWAFYDASRNRSGVWCDMAVCGNRTKVRAYRRRAPARAR